MDRQRRVENENQFTLGIERCENITHLYINLNNNNNNYNNNNNNNKNKHSIISINVSKNLTS